MAFSVWKSVGRGTGEKALYVCEIQRNVLVCEEKKVSFFEWRSSDLFVCLRAYGAPKLTVVSGESVNIYICGASSSKVKAELQELVDS